MPLGNQTETWEPDTTALKEDNMLILTRRVGESLTIGANITITVLSAKGNQIRIGVDAPEEIPVNRTNNQNQAKPDTQTKATVD